MNKVQGLNNKNGEYVDKLPGTPGTILEAKDLNARHFELYNIIEAFGIMHDVGDNAQIAQILSCILGAIEAIQSGNMLCIQDNAQAKYIKKRIESSGITKAQLDDALVKITSWMDQGVKTGDDVLFNSLTANNAYMGRSRIIDEPLYAEFSNKNASEPGKYAVKHHDTGQAFFNSGGDLTLNTMGTPKMTVKDTTGNILMGTAADNGSRLQVEGNITSTSLNTGQGNNQLHPMDQPVRTTDGVTFSTVNTGQGNNELYPMDQPVRSTDEVAFKKVSIDNKDVTEEFSAIKEDRKRTESRLTNDLSNYHMINTETDTLIVDTIRGIVPHDDVTADIVPVESKVWYENSLKQATAWNGFTKHNIDNGFTNLQTAAGEIQAEIIVPKEAFTEGETYTLYLQSENSFASVYFIKDGDHGQKFSPVYNTAKAEIIDFTMPSCTTNISLIFTLNPADAANEIPVKLNLIPFGYQNMQEGWHYLQYGEMAGFYPAYENLLHKASATAPVSISYMSTNTNVIINPPSSQTGTLSFETTVLEPGKTYTLYLKELKFIKNIYAIKASDPMIKYFSYTDLTQEELYFDLTVPSDSTGVTIFFDIKESAVSEHSVSFYLNIVPQGYPDEIHSHNKYLTYRKIDNYKSFSIEINKLDVKEIDSNEKKLISKFLEGHNGSYSISLGLYLNKLHFVIIRADYSEEWIDMDFYNSNPSIYTVSKSEGQVRFYKNNTLLHSKTNITEPANHQFKLFSLINSYFHCSIKQLLFSKNESSGYLPNTLFCNPKTTMLNNGGIISKKHNTHMQQNLNQDKNVKFKKVQAISYNIDSDKYLPLVPPYSYAIYGSSLDTAIRGNSFQHTQSNHDGNTFTQGGERGVLGCADVKYGVYGYAPTYPVAGNGAYYSSSNENLKVSKKSVSVLDALKKKPIQQFRWAWEHDDLSTVEFIAPMAQDVQETFGLDEDNEGYTTLDGIALFGVQELLREVEKLKEEIRLLKEEKSSNAP